MKKAIVLSILTLVILAGIWIGRKNTVPDRDVSAELSVPTETSPSVEYKGSDESADADYAALNSEALEIISRPVLVRVQLSDSARKMALDKIKESSDLIRANYDYVNPWYDLGAYLKMIGDYEGAVQAWTFIGKIRPNDHVSLSNLGDLYAFTLGNYAKAEEYFLESIARNPRNVDAYIQVASIYEYHDAPKLTLTEPLLLGGISANPDDASLKIALARYYKNAGDLDSARLYLQKALSANPGNSALEEELRALGN